MSGTPGNIRLKDFWYDLPEDRIAQRPLEVRDASKLLQYYGGSISHHTFRDLPGLLPAGSMLLFNDTRVIRARLYARRATGALIELLLMHPHAPAEVHGAMQATGSVVWECIIGNKKKWKPDEQLVRELELESGVLPVQIDWEDRDRNLVRLSWEGDMPFVSWLQAAGELPLPPYIHREVEEQDLVTYQTVYARHEGAVAAPTAGLHFTDQVLNDLAAKGIGQLHATLHVSAGTFLPVKTDNPVEHDMHQEQMVIHRETIEALLNQLESSHPLIPVGTTSMRWVESLYWIGVLLAAGQEPGEGKPFFVEKLTPYEEGLPELSAQEALQQVLAWMDQHQLNSYLGETAIMIMPGYQFRMCDALITNFHMPETTLMLLVAAFVGEDWRTIYETALREGYRFLSYGDSSLLWLRT